MTSLPGGSVLITGASTGIGRATAMLLDEKGMRVFAGVRREADAERLRADGSARITPVIIDVTDETGIAKARDQVAAVLGDYGLDGLVNNAGITVPGPLEYLPLADFRRQLEVNVVGQLAVTQAFLPLVRKARGRIVFVGSIGGRVASPMLGAYSASKFALEAVADTFRQELRPWGIDVAIVEPGAIVTPIWDKGRATADELEQRLPAEAKQRYARLIDAVRAYAADAEERGLPPERVAEAIAHAIRAKHPQTRYLVGRDARLQAAMATLAPDRVFDRLVAMRLKLPPNVPADATEPATRDEPTGVA